MVGSSAASCLYPSLILVEDRRGLHRPFERIVSLATELSKSAPFEVGMGFGGFLVGLTWINLD